jgi:transcriptional regulator with XRE-family HTH domain
MGREVTEVDAQIGQRIRARRIALGMSQTALAEAIGVTFQQVQKYEKGANRVASGRLQALASALNLSISDLLGTAESEGSAPMPNLSRADHQLLAAFHKLPKDARASLLALTKGMAAVVKGRSSDPTDDVISSELWPRDEDQPAAY